MTAPATLLAAALLAGSCAEPESEPANEKEPARALPPATSMMPIRGNEPGTGVFIGSGLLVRTIFDRESREAESLRTWTAVADFRYTPATHWVLGARIPFVLDRTLDHPTVGRTSTDGFGDLMVGVKHRFFRAVGPWFNRHAAVQLDLKLPTGPSDLRPGLPLPVERRARLRPGSGSVDLVADVVYQEGRGRLIWGGDLAFRLNTRGEGDYREGNEVRLNVDLEYIVLPLEYRRPGREVFLLVETTVRRKWADDIDGQPLPSTARTDLLVAPAVQHILSEQVLASLSVQLPVVSNAGDGGLEKDVNVLAELRYAF